MSEYGKDEIVDPEERTAVTIKGTFLGQPIDVTICDDVPVPAEVSKAPGPVQDLTAEGERAPDAPVDTPQADPAPDAAPVSDEAPNPAGNAEQL